MLSFPKFFVPAASRHASILSILRYQYKTHSDYRQGDMGHVFWEPFWNENTWNGSLARFFITSAHSAIVRMAVYTILCILLLGAERKVVNHLAIPKQQRIRGKFKFSRQARGKNPQSVFGMIVFFSLSVHYSIILIIPILDLPYSRAQVHDTRNNAMAFLYRCRLHKHPFSSLRLAS